MTTTIDHIAIRPGDAEYDAARETKAGAGSPAVVLRPTTPEEVAESIRYARAEGLAIAIRGGGHNAVNYGTVDDGVVIDLSRLDGVEALGDGRVRIGAGATWGPAAAALAEHGLALTSGDTISVGVGGLTQSGGIGWMVRKFGLTIDSLLAAEVVTADGDVVRASATENPDLFWGLRGGAGNFGVVTALEFQAQPVTTVQFGTIAYALDDVPALLKGWAAAMRDAPDELSSTLSLMPGFGEFPAGAMLWVCLVGDDTSALEPFRSIGTVVAEDIGARPYADVLEEGPPKLDGIVPVIGNTLVETVDDELVEAVAAAYSAGGRLVFLRGLGGAISRVDPADTAYPHRQAEALVVSAAFVPVDAPEDQVEATRSVWRTIGDRGIGSYSGFLASDTPDDLAALWPEATLERLREVKRAWDPDNVFRRNFNVAP
jgi:FAD/FMN-containing dehydrogenase